LFRSNSEKKLDELKKKQNNLQKLKQKKKMMEKKCMEMEKKLEDLERNEYLRSIQQPSTTSSTTSSNSDFGDDKISSNGLSNNYSNSSYSSSSSSSNFDFDSDFDIKSSTSLNSSFDSYPNSSGYSNSSYASSSNDTSSNSSISNSNSDGMSSIQPYSWNNSKSVYSSNSLQPYSSNSSNSLNSSDSNSLLFSFPGVDRGWVDQIVNGCQLNVLKNGENFQDPLINQAYLYSSSRIGRYGLPSEGKQTFDKYLEIKSEVEMYLNQQKMMRQKCKQFYGMYEAVEEKKLGKLNQKQTSAKKWQIDLDAKKEGKKEKLHLIKNNNRKKVNIKILTDRTWEYLNYITLSYYWEKNLIKRGSVRCRPYWLRLA